MKGHLTWTLLQVFTVAKLITSTQLISFLDFIRKDLKEWKKDAGDDVKGKPHTSLDCPWIGKWLRWYHIIKQLHHDEIQNLLVLTGLVTFLLWPRSTGLWNFKKAHIINLSFLRALNTLMVTKSQAYTYEGAWEGSPGLGDCKGTPVHLLFISLHCFLMCKAIIDQVSPTCKTLQWFPLPLTWCSCPLSAPGMKFSIGDPIKLNMLLLLMLTIKTKVSNNWQ